MSPKWGLGILYLITYSWKIVDGGDFFCYFMVLHFKISKQSDTEKFKWTKVVFYCLWTQYFSCKIRFIYLFFLPVLIKERSQQRLNQFMFEQLTRDCKGINNQNVKPWHLWDPKRYFKDVKIQHFKFKKREREKSHLRPVPLALSVFHLNVLLGWKWILINEYCLLSGQPFFVSLTLIFPWCLKW